MADSIDNPDLAPSPQAPHPIGPRTTVKDVAAVVFRRQKIIFVVFFSTLAAAVPGGVWFGKRLFPARYSAEVKFGLQKDRPDALATPGGLTAPASLREVYSEMELLKSADVLERVARDTRVPGERLRRELTVDPVAADRSSDRLIAARYSSPDPAEVKRVLNTLPEIYLEKRPGGSGPRPQLDSLRAQVEALEQQWREADQKLAEFRKQQPPPRLDARDHQPRQKLSELEKQRLETEAAIRDAESRAAEFAKQLDALPAVVPPERRAEEPPYLQRLKTELLELESRRARATYYREIERLDLRIGELRQAIDREAQPAGGVSETPPDPTRASLETELLRSRAVLAGLRARRVTLAGQEHAAREQLVAYIMAARSAGRMAELARRAKSAEESLALYRKKYAEAQTAESLDRQPVPSVSVAEWPRPPVPVNRMNIWPYLALGLLVAAVAGAASGFVAERLDRSIHTPRQLEDLTTLTVLACIPQTKAS